MARTSCGFMTSRKCFRSPASQIASSIRGSARRSFSGRGNLEWSRYQLQQICRFAVDRRFCVTQREVLALEPQRQQIVVVRAAGLPALPRNIDAHRVVPVVQIENLAVACASQLVKGTSAKIRSIHCIAIPGPGGRAQVEKRGSTRRDSSNWMNE